MISASEIAEEFFKGFCSNAHQEVNRQIDRIHSAPSIKERWNALRAFYALIDTKDYEPYFVDWMKIMTPIESAVWQDIRQFGLPFWPQYPACGVFFDFADPHKKIAIECDGKRWHDAKVDAERDKKANECGWSVYRLSGAECFRDDAHLHELAEECRETDSEEFTQAFQWYAFNTATGLMNAIAISDYGRNRWDMSEHIAQQVLSRRAGGG